jgi:hypothetical protein
LKLEESFQPTTSIMKFVLIVLVCAFNMAKAQYPLVNGTCTLCPIADLSGIPLADVRIKFAD